MTDTTVFRATLDMWPKQFLTNFVFDLLSIYFMMRNDIRNSVPLCLPWLLRLLPILFQFLWQPVDHCLSKCLTNKNIIARLLLNRRKKYWGSFSMYFVQRSYSSKFNVSAIWKRGHQDCPRNLTGCRTVLGKTFLRVVDFFFIQVKNYKLWLRLSGGHFGLRNCYNCL